VVTGLAFPALDPADVSADGRGDWPPFNGRRARMKHNRRRRQPAVHERTADCVKGPK
jgi:hypothetical protein